MPKIVAKHTPAGCLARGGPGRAEPDRKALQDLALVWKCAPDDLIAQEGSRSSGVYLVCEGLVVIGKTSVAGSPAR